MIKFNYESVQKMFDLIMTFVVAHFCPSVTNGVCQPRAENSSSIPQFMFMINKRRSSLDLLPNSFLDFDQFFSKFLLVSKF